MWTTKLFCGIIVILIMALTLEQLNSKIDGLEKDLSSTKTEIQNLKTTINNPPQIRLDRYLDNTSKDIIEDIVSERIIDITWDDYFYFHSFPEAVDGWAVSGGGASTGVSGAGVTLQTGAVATNSASAGKLSLNQQVLTYDEIGRFRTTFETGSVADTTINIGIGTPTSSNNHYGFRVINDTLYGVTGNGSSETTRSLGTIGANNAYTIEARLFPGQRVDFYVSDSDKANLQIKGSITTTLPTGLISSWLDLLIRTEAASAKFMYVNYMEYIQKRPQR